jgi:hypothetical protein
MKKCTGLGGVSSAVKARVPFQIFVTKHFGVSQGTPSVTPKNTHKCFLMFTNIYFCKVCNTVITGGGITPQQLSK